MSLLGFEARTADDQPGFTCVTRLVSREVEPVECGDDLGAICGPSLSLEKRLVERRARQDDPRTADTSLQLSTILGDVDVVRVCSEAVVESPERRCGTRD